MTRKKKKKKVFIRKNLKNFVCENKFISYVFRELMAPRMNQWLRNKS